MLLLVIQRDYREIRSSTVFRIMLLVAVFVTLFASLGISIALRLQSWFGVSEEAPILDLILALVVYFVPFLLLLAFIWGFTGLPIIKEKVNGNIECLMATPMSPRVLWIGKSLAIFLPAYIISLVATAVVVMVINLVVVLPGWATLALPGPALVNGLIVNPLFFFALLAFIVLFSLAVNPDSAVAPSFIVGFGLMIGIPVGLLTGVINLNAWSFVLWYLAASAAAWLIVLLMTRLLKGQTIVLSVRGG